MCYFTSRGGSVRASRLLHRMGSLSELHRSLLNRGEVFSVATTYSQSQRSILIRGDVFSVATKYSHSRRSILTRNEVLSLATKYSHSRRSILTRDEVFSIATKYSHSRRSILTRGKVYSPEAKYPYSRRSLLTRGDVSSLEAMSPHSMRTLLTRGDVSSLEDRVRGYTWICNHRTEPLWTASHLPVLDRTNICIFFFYIITFVGNFITYKQPEMQPLMFGYKCYRWMWSCYYITKHYASFLAKQ